MILGSAAKIPETSVQFSYKETFRHFAKIEPVTSEPPRDNSFTLPLG